MSTDIVTDYELEIRKKAHGVLVDRSVLAGLRARLTDSKLAWEDANAELLQEVENRAAILSGNETVLRELALEAYNATGKNIKQWPGVTVKVFADVKYAVADALRWAKEYAPIFVVERLDSKAFETWAKSAAERTDMLFTLEERPQVNIASDLSKALGE